MSNHLPGRLGNPDMTILEDPRLDARIREVMAATAGIIPPIEPPPPGDYEAALAYCTAFEEFNEATHPMQFDAIPDLDSVVRRTETIQGIDGNDITLYIHEPAERDGPAACVVHTHGGGMVMMTAADPMFVRLRDSLANEGVVVVGVEFRNGGGKLGNHPFPAGLNDCVSAVRWTHENRSALDIRSITISGESGGGNLSIATTLHTLRQGRIQVDGVYAFCPYISGAYGAPPPNLLSLTENDGYMLECSMMAMLVGVYDPTGEHANNPLAWPLTASPDDLAGLPPHLITVNELDPLRDEGLEYYRMLSRAGVSAVARTVHGTPHAGDLSFPDVTPDIYAETVRSVAGFAKSLPPAGA